MIVIAYKPGQLANRLFLFSKFLAYGYAHRVRVVNPSFGEYASYFQKTKNQFIPASEGFVLFSSGRIINAVYHFFFYVGRMIHRFSIKRTPVSVTYLEWDQTFDLDSTNVFGQNKLYLIQGWAFHASALLKTHKPKIIHFFRPSEKYYSAINLFLASIKNRKRLIGVHVRHGDYQFFEGGKYFFELSVYKSILEQLNEKEQELTFLICTNNKSISKTDFGNLNVTMAPGHELIDLYLLSACDYIIGPPSTYSAWASYYGDKPLYQIKEPNRTVHFSDFKIADV